MEDRSVHESDAKLMSADDVWEDAQAVAAVIERNQTKEEPVVRLPILLSVFVSALEQFNREELMVVRQHIEKRLAA